jgi:DNA-binding transcriptional MerR regulator
LDPAPRTESGYRNYGPETVGRLQFLLRAKALGLSLQEVHRLLTGPSVDTATERDRLRHLVAHKIADNRRRISELQALSEELESLYVRLLRSPVPECGHLGDCPLWLPTDEEVKIMSEEIACCGEVCCPDCSCSQGGPCDCPDCACSAGRAS